MHNLECVAHGSQPVARPRSEVLLKAGRSERVLRLLELLHLKEPRTHTPLLTPLAYRRCRACGSTITLSSKLWPSIGYWTCGGAFGCCFLQNRGLSQLTGTCQLDLRCRFKRNPRQNFHYFKAPTICMGTSNFGNALFAACHDSHGMQVRHGLHMSETSEAEEVRQRDSVTVHLLERCQRDHRKV